MENGFKRADGFDSQKLKEESFGETPSKKREKLEILMSNLLIQERIFNNRLNDVILEIRNLDEEKVLAEKAHDDALFNELNRKSEILFDYYSDILFPEKEEIELKKESLREKINRTKDNE